MKDQHRSTTVYRITIERFPNDMFSIYIPNTGSKSVKIDSLKFNGCGNIQGSIL